MYDYPKKQNAINQLANAISHFHPCDISKLHFKAFPLTIFVKDPQCMSYLPCCMYRKILGLTKQHARAKGLYAPSIRPGLIMCGDTEGSRHGPVCAEPVHPHLHGLLIAPTRLLACISLCRLDRELRLLLEGFEEVMGVWMKEVVLERCVTSLVDTVDYILKPMYKTPPDLRDADCYAPSVYPYLEDNKRSKNREAINKQKAERAGYIIKGKYLCCP